MRVGAALALAGLLVSCSAGQTVVATALPSPRVSPSPAAAATGTSTPAPAASPTEAIPMNWIRIPDIPTPRSEVGATVFANTIFVIGGFGGARVVERYVTISVAWKREPDLPIGVDHAMAAAIQGGPGFGVYVFGGNTDGGPSRRSFYLAPSAQMWEEVAPMPATRQAGAAVAIGRRIYVVGGAASSNTLHNSVYEYDVDRNAWSIRADIPTARDHLAAVALGGRVCAVGGRLLSLTRNLGALECYDPATDRWEKLPSMPTARGGIGAAVVGDRIVVVGGEQQSGTFKEVEIYDAKGNAWSRYLDDPTPRHGLGVVAIGSTVYALAGGPTPGGSQTAICETLTLR